MPPSPPAPDMKRLMTLHVKGVGWESVSARLCMHPRSAPCRRLLAQAPAGPLQQRPSETRTRYERRNGARLEHVQPARMDGPFDILGRAEVLDRPVSQLPEAIHVTAVETGLRARRFIRRPILLRGCAAGDCRQAGPRAPTPVRRSTRSVSGWT